MLELQRLKTCKSSGDYGKHEEKAHGNDTATFHTRGPQAEKARSLTAERRVRRQMPFRSSCVKWQFNDFVCGNLSLNNYEFLHNFYNRVGNDDWSPARFLAEILRTRDDDFTVLFSDGGRLSTSELNCILSYVASSRS